MRAATRWALLVSLAACAPAPSADERTASADRIAVSARLRDAEQAQREGRFAAAEMALLRALGSGGAAVQAASTAAERPTSHAVESAGRTGGPVNNRRDPKARARGERAPW